MFNIGDEVFVMAEPDRFGRVFSYYRAVVTAVDAYDIVGDLPLNNYTVKVQQHDNEIKEFYTVVSAENVYPDKDSCVKAIKARNSAAKIEEIYQAEQRIKEAQETIDAWKGFDPDVVEIKETEF